MQEYTEKIQEIARQLLADGKVDMVVGFTKGTMPLASVPFCARTPEDADKLIFDSNCWANLANYLTGRKEKIGVVVKGCDSRSVVNHIVENKIDREQLVVIGVPCQGVIDRKRVAAAYEGEIQTATEEGDSLQVTGTAGEKTFAKADVLADNCTVCVHHNPVIHDELVGKLLAESDVADRYAKVETVEKMALKERWDFFENMFSTCIRCYACRNACPLCYCPTCFVDEAKPQWVGKSQDKTDIRTFHFLRAYHCAGRCVDCGACVQACPMGIDVRFLTKKLEKDCLDLYGWESGLSTEQRPALDAYSPNDPNQMFK